MLYDEIKEINSLNKDDSIIEEIERLIDLHINELKEKHPDDLSELYFEDEVFRIADSVWDSVLNTGLITRDHYQPDSDDLASAITILEWADKVSFIAQDGGLWCDLSPKKSLVSQAFFSLQNIIRDKLKDSDIQCLTD